MPWTVKSPPTSYKNFPAARLAKAVKIANAALKACMKKGGAESDCAASAIRIGAAQSK